MPIVTKHQATTFCGLYLFDKVAVAPATMAKGAMEKL
jgi:hypothetical protein